MSGHSKWSKVKHQKAVTDAVKGKAFTKASHVISIAVAEGGGVTDPAMNFRLRLAMEKAREVNMPKDKIERAIARGKGEDGGTLEQVLYEAYGPGGVAVIIEATTDNKQRTVAVVKNVLDRNGGTLASPGSVSYMFKRAGILVIPKAADHTIDTIMDMAIMGGADNVIEQDDVYEVYTDPTKLNEIRQHFEKQSMTIENAELIMNPTTTIVIDGYVNEQLEKLIDLLEELDDVQRVYTNIL